MKSIFSMAMRRQEETSSLESQESISRVTPPVRYYCSGYDRALFDIFQSNWRTSEVIKFDDRELNTAKMKQTKSFHSMESVFSCHKKSTCDVLLGVISTLSGTDSLIHKKTRLDMHRNQKQFWDVDFCQRTLGKAREHSREVAVSVGLVNKIAIEE